MTAKRGSGAPATRRDLRHLAETFDRGFMRLESRFIGVDSRFEGLDAALRRIDSKVIALRLMADLEKTRGQ